MQTSTGESKPSITPVTSTEEDYWAEAMSELEGVNRRPGLWAKAFAEAQGNEDAAKANYLKWRVVQLKDEEAKRVHKIEEAQQQKQADKVEMEHLCSFQSKGQCPNCESILPMASMECPRCKAVFGRNSAWQLLPLK